MKTTVEIQDTLLREVRALAEVRSTTLRSLIEDGLRMVLRQQAVPPGFHLPDCSYQGDGFNEHFEKATWAELRAEIYGDVP